MKRSTLTIAAMTVAAIAAIVALIVWKHYLVNELGSEGYKQILQFSLITVIGGLVSVLYAEFKREQDQKAIHRTHLLTFYNGVLAQYNKSKKLRRLLRALAAKSQDLSAEECERRYVDLLVQLEDVQLEFESFRRQVMVQGRMFPEHGKVESKLYGIQDALREVVREYEEGKFAHGSGIALDRLPCLHRFLLETSQGGDYVDRISVPFEEVEGVLLRELDRDA